jgi:hypothetical protein
MAGGLGSGGMYGLELVFLGMSHSTDVDTHTHTSTHPYEYTYAHHIPMSTSERLDRRS